MRRLTKRDIILIVVSSLGAFLLCGLMMWWKAESPQPITEVIVCDTLPDYLTPGLRKCTEVVPELDLPELDSADMERSGMPERWIVPVSINIGNQEDKYRIDTTTLLAELDDFNKAQNRITLVLSSVQHFIQPNYLEEMRLNAALEDASFGYRDRSDKASLNIAPTNTELLGYTPIDVDVRRLWQPRANRVFVAQDAYRYVTAHEFGHWLGLPHDETEKNIMNAYAIDSCCVNYFTEAQADKMYVYCQMYRPHVIINLN